MTGAAAGVTTSGGGGGGEDAGGGDGLAARGGGGWLPGMLSSATLGVDCWGSNWAGDCS